MINKTKQITAICHVCLKQLFKGKQVNPEFIATSHNIHVLVCCVKGNPLLSGLMFSQINR